jgi:hypothetical protein
MGTIPKVVKAAKVAGTNSVISMEAPPRMPPRSVDMNPRTLIVETALTYFALAASEVVAEERPTVTHMRRWISCSGILDTRIDGGRGFGATSRGS